MPNSINDNVERLKPGNTASNLTYLLAGCGIGATLALLFAPKSGRELRSDISDITRAGYDETLELAHELKGRSAELYHSIRDSADRVYDLAAAKLHLAEKAIEDTKQTAGELVNGEIGRKGRKTPNKQAGAERPSNIY